MNLLQDVRDLVLARLPHEPNDRQTLESFPVHDLLTIYLNWLGRLVPTQPHRVHISAALRANPLAVDPRYKPALDQIATVLAAGGDIRAHLSRLTINGFQSPKPEAPKDLARRKDLDLLLNDWGVHHLHLSTTIDADGFVKRTGPLLFAAFSPGNAYLIDIFDHGKWAEEHTIRVMVKEWSSAGLVHKLNGVLSLSSPVSESNRKKLRAAGVLTPVEVEGAVYVPRTMFSTAGTSMRTTMCANIMLSKLGQFAKEVESQPDFIPGILASVVGGSSREPDLHFDIFESGGYGVVEKGTGVIFMLAASWRI